MIKLLKNFVSNNENGFFQEVGWTWLGYAINQRNYEYVQQRNMSIALVLLDYGNWQADSDIFQYLSSKVISFLQKRKNTYLVLDASLEGFGPKTFPILECLYYNCEKYKISPKKIIYATSNRYESRNNAAFCLHHGRKDSIKIYTSNHFQYQTGQNFRNDKGINFITTEGDPWPLDTFYDKIKGTTYKQYNGKYFLSLSRIVRSHRTLGHFLLHAANIEKHALISQDKLKQTSGDMHNALKDQGNAFIENFARDINVDPKQFVRWSKTLPRIIDTPDFKTNHGPKGNYGLYTKTLFEVVNETDANGFDGTQLFYSEKTFKPMINGMPFIIFGQQYANSHLKELGFKLYDELFDYSFDNEPDVKKRYLLIIAMIQDRIKMFNKMSKEEQLEWRFQCEDKLKYNMSKVILEEKDDPALEKLLQSMYRECGFVL